MKRIVPRGAHAGHTSCQGSTGKKKTLNMELIVAGTQSTREWERGAVSHRRGALVKSTQCLHGPAILLPADAGCSLCMRDCALPDTHVHVYHTRQCVLQLCIKEMATEQMVRRHRKEAVATTVQTTGGILAGWWRDGGGRGGREME